MNLIDKIISESSRCVMCGLCLPHCPTYTQTRNENESPRGRIAIARALAEEQLPVSEKLYHHIDQCLLCRACERACPSGVAYGSLIDMTRQLLNEKGFSGSGKLTQQLTTSRKTLKMVGVGLWLYQRSGLHWLIKKSGVTRHSALAQMASFVPEKLSLKNWQTFYPAIAAEQGRVALFTGCVANIADQQTLQSSIDILNLAGLGVYIPAQQGCCGALHLHNGDVEQTKEMARNNIQAFSELGINSIITTATGCSTTLLDYGKLIEHESAEKFSLQIKDIHQFLADINWEQNLDFLPLDKTILVHEPCSMKNIKGLKGIMQQLLNGIPEIKTRSLPEKMHCCGAGGDYMLKHPEMARQLREPVIEHLQQHPADILVTSNIGCAMHIKAGIEQAGLHTEVMHPITLLKRQLANQTLSCAS